MLVEHLETCILVDQKIAKHITQEVDQLIIRLVRLRFLILDTFTGLNLTQLQHHALVWHSTRWNTILMILRSSHWGTHEIQAWNGAWVNGDYDGSSLRLSWHRIHKEKVNS